MREPPHFLAQSELRQQPKRESAAENKSPVDFSTQPQPRSHFPPHRFIRDHPADALQAVSDPLAASIHYAAASACFRRSNHVMPGEIHRRHDQDLLQGETVFWDPPHKSLMSSIRHCVL
jgi:hypothetical protein